MKLRDFYFDLPEDSIARFPAERRDDAKLMVIDKQSGHISHHVFRDLPQLLSADDFLVVNDSMVIPVRLFGRIGGKVCEVLIIRIMDNQQAEVFALPARKFKPGTAITFDHGYAAEVMQLGERGRRILKFDIDLDTVLKSGFAPLPPYIKRKWREAAEYKSYDLERYQTVYSKLPGSIAAPTAGLHFTQELVERIGKNNEIIHVTLNVGAATFQKIDVDDISDHQMGREYITIKKRDMDRILTLKQDKKLVAVGTTSVRSLETWAVQRPESEEFYSDLFIYPGYKFAMVDKLLTNFHLPESSLFILVSAFAGLDLMKEAYRTAIENRYRFFSYGDAMFIK